jgi:hypothetical protein
MSVSPPGMRIRFVARRAARLSSFALALVAPRAAFAQGYPFSQRATISQNVALTTITVSYGRPVARGRPLFGQLVPWDSVWHPGADSATRVVFDHDVKVEGHDLRAGEYSLWLVPHEHRPWTVIFSRAAHTFHKPYPGEADDVLRVDVTPESASHVETLEIEFPLVLRDDAVMRIHWGTVGVPIRIKAPYKPD